MGRLLELLGPDECVGEVGKEPCRHDAREPIIEDHGMLLLQPVADVGVGDRGCEEAKSESDQDEIKHRVTFARRRAAPDGSGDA